jgi:sugar phosphate isomerase/epimerase
MKLSVMTLGCPAWDLETIIARASEYGYDAIDFRGVLNEIDITKLPAFTTGVAATRRQLQNANLETSGISSSITACDPDRLAANLEEARRTIPVALALGATNIRIFGGGPVDKIGREEAARIGRDCVAQILALPGAEQISWNFETHDHWIKTDDCLLLLNKITHPAFNALWDIGHTSRVGNQTPDQTIAAIGPRIRYVHVKDAAFDKSHPQAMSDGWRYVLPGTGQLPLARGIHLLAQNGYTGYLLFEHEKRWHPDLPEPEIAFPAFIKWIDQIRTSE